MNGTKSFQFVSVVIGVLCAVLYAVPVFHPKEKAATLASSTYTGMIGSVVVLAILALDREELSIIQVLTKSLPIIISLVPLIIMRQSFNTYENQVEKPTKGVKPLLVVSFFLNFFLLLSLFALSTSSSTSTGLVTSGKAGLGISVVANIGYYITSILLLKQLKNHTTQG